MYKSADTGYHTYPQDNLKWRRNKKWNESGFRPPLCTYRLNWARRTSWGWWDDWDDTVLQTQNSKFEPWRSEAEHATSRSRRLPTILTFTRGWGRNNFVSFKPPRPGTEPRTLAWKAAVLTTTLGPPPYSHKLKAKYSNNLKWRRNTITCTNQQTLCTIPILRTIWKGGKIPSHVQISGHWVPYLPPGQSEKEEKYHHMYTSADTGYHT